MTKICFPASAFLTIVLAALTLLPSCKRSHLGSEHVIIVMEENHGFDQLIGSPNAPFINQLAQEGALFTNSHGITHPSQSNYLALYSGSTQGIPDDRCLDSVTPYTTGSLGGALLARGLTFTGFAETMPSEGYTGCQFQHTDLTNGVLYARKHAPWVNWQGTKRNNIPSSWSKPMTAFPKDFNDLPDVAFVIPNQDNDMHNIGEPGDSAAIRRGDNWLKANLGQYVEWAKTHNSLFILTFDEDDFTPQNRIPTIFHGPMVKPGKYAERIDHYSVLHTLDNMFNLPVWDSTGATSITSIWNKPTH